MYREKTTTVLPGIPMLLLLLFGVLGSIAMFVALLGTAPQPRLLHFTWLLVTLLCAFGLGGLFLVNPNEGMVLQLFGSYVGTTKVAGLLWANPFLSKRKVSLRVRTFESSRLKVNDLDGNPIEIAAVVTWKVVDTAEAVFNVDNFEQFVNVQSEAALRNLATHFPYDAHDEEKVSLRGHTSVVAGKLRDEIQERLNQAGVEVLESRISHLAYAQEIAQAMLQRQQAGAIIAARKLIVDGAVGMVEMALARLDEHGTVRLDEERKAAMVSNLLVVLCSERAASPVVNAGTIYH